MENYKIIIKLLIIIIITITYYVSLVLNVFYFVSFVRQNWQKEHFVHVPCTDIFRTYTRSMRRDKQPGLCQFRLT